MRWRELRHLPLGQRPELWLHAWLLDKESLTAKLMALSDRDFYVQVLYQKIEPPQLNERQLLGMGDKTRALVREVVLCGKNQPWVFARSVLPLSSLEGPLRHLRKQDSRPLGAFLFSQPHLKRGAIAVTAISRDHGYVPHTLMGEQRVWGRRSVFSLYGKPLLVSEVFLEPLIQVLAQDQKQTGSDDE
jgi:chorismate--pyruvate lyase